MPAGSLVTVPSPLPCLFAVSVTRSEAARSNCGNAVTSLLSVMMHGLLAPHGMFPDQPVSVDPAAGVPVNVTTVPVGNAATHVGPQSMPGGWLVTVPNPVPIFCTVRFDVPTGGLNVAVTDRFTSITTEQSAPLQSPVQPAKVDPGAAVAVKVTELPVGKLALHVPPQSIPLGALVTVPDPDPLFCTVSVDMGGGTIAVKIAVTV